jgi:hypothetical protein
MASQYALHSPHLWLTLRGPSGFHLRELVYGERPWDIFNLARPIDCPLFTVSIKASSSQ